MLEMFTKWPEKWIRRVAAALWISDYRPLNANANAKSNCQNMRDLSDLAKRRCDNFLLLRISKPQAKTDKITQVDSTRDKFFTVDS